MSREYDEQSADMRLVELQRSRLDLPERPRRWAQDPQTIEESFSGAARVDLATPELQEAVIFGSLHVSPSRSLIPGALVTVALVVENAGGAPASVRARLTLSLDAGYRPGTTTLDGREIPDVDEGSMALGAVGADLGAIAPGERRRLALMAKLGTAREPLRITGTLDAGGAATLGIAPLEVERGGVGAFAQAVAERLAAPEPLAPAAPAADAPTYEPPPYELEPEEELVYEAADAALASTPAITWAPPEPEPPEPEPPAPEPPAPEPPMPQPPAPGPAAPEPPAPEPFAPAAAPRVAAPTSLLWNTIDVSTVRFLGRVLKDGSSLGLLGHFMVANGLIARFAPQGLGNGDSLGLGKFSAEQAGLLNRLMLQARMKRATSLEHYATPPPIDRLQQVDALQRIDATALETALPSAQAGSLVLYATLSASDLAFLQRTASAEKTPPFVRNRQITAALLPRHARSAGGNVENISSLLAAYAEASLAAITRFFVQLRLTPSLLPTAIRDEDLERAASSLLAGFDEALQGEA